MEYTIKKAAQMSGVSTRTLRYYDEISLLKPARINSSGYRIYGRKEMDRLQQILFYRSMDMKLEDIRQILDKPDFDYQKALEEHYEALLQQKHQIDLLLTTIEQTIAYQKGEIQMKDSEKFKAFKKEKLDENEQKYGKEIREKYGETTVEASNKKWQNMSEEDFNEMNQTQERLFATLGELMQSKDLDSQSAKEAYELHKKWLSFSWPSYSPEAHKGLVDMYLADERFAAYYNDAAGEEAAQWLHDAVYRYAQQQSFHT